tara:strand:- start:3126 stop:3752 length:627 start_codon:yes stop_codon:yes gene_type:complete
MTKKERELVVEKGTDSKEAAMAKIGLSPTVNAASTIEIIRGEHFGGLDIGSLTKVLKDQVEATKHGGLDRAESLLLSQAHTLDAIFNSLCVRSAANMGEYINSVETYMRLALRAQNQCQATLRTLGELKTPKSVAFVKQANIAENQQVNNGIATQPETATPAQETKNPQNELLEDNNGERLDTGAKTQAGRDDKVMETVGAVNRPKEL